MPAPPTLFLDFDGILHPNLADPGQLFKQAPLLADALDGHALQIVVSSSLWFQFEPPSLRNHRRLHELIRFGPSAPSTVPVLHDTGRSTFC